MWIRQRAYSTFTKELGFLDLSVGTEVQCVDAESDSIIVLLFGSHSDEIFLKNIFFVKWGDVM